MIFKTNNRLDIYDVAQKIWREARVVDSKEVKGTKSIKISYRGYNSKYDEWLDCNKEAARIKEVGSYSGAEGHAKYSQRIQ